MEQLTGSAQAGLGAVAAKTAQPERLEKRSWLETFLFVSPGALWQLVFGWYPIIAAFIITILDYKIFGGSQFVGVQNYIRMWQDPLTWTSIKLTYLYTVFSIVLTFIIPIVVAILLMEMPPRAVRIMMLLWFLPVSGMAFTILWKYFYNVQYGLMQSIMQALHLPKQAFLSDPNKVMFWMIFPGIIMYGPGMIYLASLQSIPASLYEAAEVEGARFWRKLWTVTLPRIRPIIVMYMTFALIGTPQTFDWPYVLTGGGPGGATRLVAIYIYEKYTQLRFSDATVLAVFLFVLVMASVVLLRTFVKENPDE